MRVFRVLRDDAVSPVIGIILMVAITVILATTIGTFALGLGDQTPEGPPQTTWDFTYPNATYSGTGDVVEIEHTGGETVDSNTGVKVGDSRVAETAALRFGGGSIDLPITSGDTITVEEDGANEIQSGDDVLVIYRPNKPEIRSIIGSDEVP